MSKRQEKSIMPFFHILQKQGHTIQSKSLQLKKILEEIHFYVTKLPLQEL